MSDIEIRVPVEREMTIAEFMNRMQLARSRVGPEAKVSIAAEVPPDPPYANPTPPAIVIRGRLT